MNDKSVGTPAPDDTWHVFLSGLAHLDFPQRRHVARFSYPDFLKKKHTTLANITFGRSSYHIRTTDISYPDMFVRIVD